MVREILLLGDPRLYEVSTEVKKEELTKIQSVVRDLHDTLINFRKEYHAGRAVAAPQIGVFKRILYMYIDKPVVFINPVLEFPDEEKMDVMDDCMSFPGLLVKVSRYRRCIIRYKNELWEDCLMELSGDLSELLQHEYDHLEITMKLTDFLSFPVFRAEDLAPALWISVRNILAKTIRQ